jgi:hypothetical protein
MVRREFDEDFVQEVIELTVMPPSRNVYTSLHPTSLGRLSQKAEPEFVNLLKEPRNRYWIPRLAELNPGLLNRLQIRALSTNSRMRRNTFFFAGAKVLQMFF